MAIPGMHSLEFTLTPPLQGPDLKNVHQVLRNAIPTIVSTSTRGDGKTTRVTLRAKEAVDPAAVSAVAASQGWGIEFPNGGVAES